LVTGATGVVGANLVRELLSDGHEVRVLLRPSSDVRAIDGLDVSRCTGDVMDGATVARAAKHCEIVYHAAALFSYTVPAAEQQRLAVEGTRTTLRAAKKAGTRRVVLTSSAVVVGSSEKPEIRDEAAEFDEVAPAPYTISKVHQEDVAFEVGHALGLEVVALRPTLVVGAHDYRLSPSNANISNYLNDPFRSTFIGGCNIVDARDVGRAHVIAGTAGEDGGRYIAGGENLSWRDVHSTISELAGTFGPSVHLNHTASYLAAVAAEIAARLAGIRPAVTRDEARMAARFYWYTHRRLSRLAYRPRSAREALANALAWLLYRGYVAHGTAERLRPLPEVEDARAAFASGSVA
jgi:dihydroflavonol-4-reductase